ncbi:MAG: nitrate- and nitrite sensing domain-containing protein [Gammaproteobacteria bacterium]
MILRYAKSWFAIPAATIVIVVMLVGIIVSASLHDMRNEQGKSMAAAAPWQEKLWEPAVALLDALQGERDGAALLLASRGRMGAGDAWLASDAVVNDFKRTADEFLQHLPDPQFFSGRLAALRRSLNRLAEMRKRVSALHATIGTVISYYSALDAMVLELLAEMPRWSRDKDDLQLALGRFYLLHLEERAALEGTVLTHAFASGHFGPGLRDAFVSLVAAQDSYSRVFLALAPQQARTSFQEMRSSLGETLARFRDRATGQIGVGAFKVSLQPWLQFSERRQRGFHGLRAVLREAAAAVQPASPVAAVGQPMADPGGGPRAGCPGPVAPWPRAAASAPADKGTATVAWGGHAAGFPERAALG